MRLAKGCHRHIRKVRISKCFFNLLPVVVVFTLFSPWMTCVLEVQTERLLFHLAHGWLISVRLFSMSCFCMLFYSALYSTAWCLLLLFHCFDFIDVTQMHVPLKPNYYIIRPVSKKSSRPGRERHSFFSDRRKHAYLYEKAIDRLLKFWGIALQSGLAVRCRRLETWLRAQQECLKIPLSFPPERDSSYCG